MRRVPVVEGQRYGRLVVIGLAPPRGRRIFWQFRCDCGSIYEARAQHVRSGLIESCRCLHREVMSRVGKAQATHGMTGTPEFKTWEGILQRCNNPNSPAYRYYGGRGIRVCIRWMKFENFYTDMGPRSSPKHSIERINNEGYYAPNNCKWATMKEQAANRRNAWITRRQKYGANGRRHTSAP